MTGANPYFRTMTATATVLVLAASLSACFDSKPVTAPSGVKSPPTSTVTVTAAPSGATTTTAPSAATTTGSSGTMLADLRLGRRDDGDRLVLQFTGAAPPYRISRTAGPVADCGSGNPATGPGEFLVLTAEPVAMMDDEGRPAYTGPATVAGPGGAISRAVITCRFEAQLQVAVQLTGNNQRYTDSTLTGPGRIVVDVKN
ncbi:Lipoprotein OS=Tsukamurella paurometabola (strain ATCC 8368 / DSM / CCUG 35730 / CIP 100753/ JCM 10117 / KCTC 9821 / NBRC 16120 / NCIMB 702349 / NCTC 13040)OX=521096 GN=Tpau_1059 PE=4 SV=1 [Tsukamurella paurometabola]